MTNRYHVNAGVPLVPLEIACLLPVLLAEPVSWPLTPEASRDRPNRLTVIRILLVSRRGCEGARGRGGARVGVASWWVREWLHRRAGRQGAEPVTLAMGVVPSALPGLLLSGGCR